jgi:hypothetical protein
LLTIYRYDNHCSRFCASCQRKPLPT